VWISEFSQTRISEHGPRGNESARPTRAKTYQVFAISEQNQSSIWSFSEVNLYKKMFGLSLQCCMKKPGLARAGPRGRWVRGSGAQKLEVATRGPQAWVAAGAGRFAPSRQQRRYTLVRGTVFNKPRQNRARWAVPPTARRRAVRRFANHRRYARRPPLHRAPPPLQRPGPAVRTVARFARRSLRAAAIPVSESAWFAWSQPFLKGYVTCVSLSLLL
jgi:hypothetical protein